MSFHVVITALCITALGCAGGSPAAKGGGVRLDRAIEFDGSEGSDLMHLEPRPTDVVLLDSSRKTLARYRIEDGYLLVRATGSARDAVVVRAAAGERGLRILEGPAGKVLYTLRGEADGDLRLDDAGDQTLYEIKLREYGLKVERGDGQTQAKVRVKQDKISVRNPAGKTVFTTRDPIPPAMAAVLTMNELPLTFRVGLGLAILHWGEGIL